MSRIDRETKEQLRKSFSKRVSFDELERKIYAHDMGVMPSMVKPLVGDAIPEGIVQPESEQELVELLSGPGKEHQIDPQRQGYLWIWRGIAGARRPGGGVQPPEPHNRYFC